MPDLILIAFCAHIVWCLFLLLLIKTDVLKVSNQLFPLALFLPVFGTLMLLTAEYLSRKAKNGTKDIQVDDLKLDDPDIRGTNLSQEELTSVVPIEEAIFVNDAKTRREFLINIIGQDASDYINLLQKAKFNDDIEVIHYASTAIMEIQREHELAVQRCEIALQINPEDAVALDHYVVMLKKYIMSGLVEENFLYIQRSRYHEAIMKRIGMKDVDPSSYFDAVDNLIEMNRFTDAEEILKQAAERWPEDEKILLLNLKICHMSKDRDKRDILIQDLSGKRMHLSLEAREAIQFWSR